MGGTFEGLGVPLCGAFTRYAANGTTTAWAVSANGAIDFGTFTNLGADNYVSCTISDSTTVASGYVQAFYANVTVGGSHSDQIWAFAGDVTFGGTISSESGGMYIYIAGTGTPTVTNLNLKGYVVNFEDVGSASLRAGFYAYSNSANVASGQDCAFGFYCSGATGTFTSILGGGGSTPPEYFLHWYTAYSGDKFIVDYSASSSATKALRVNVNGTVYNIAMVPDSCS